MTHHWSAETSLQSVSCYCHRNLFTTNFSVNLHSMHISFNIQVTYIIIHHEMYPCKDHSLFTHSPNVKQFQLFLHFNVAVNATILPSPYLREAVFFISLMYFFGYMSLHKQAGLVVVHFCLCLFLCYCPKK